MSTSKLTFRSLINRPLEQVIEWHLRPNMEKRVIPPWEALEIKDVKGRPDLEGSLLRVHAKLWGPFWKDCLLEYRHFNPEESFEISQVQGPFTDWSYKMKVRQQEEHACEIIDCFTFTHQYPKILSYLMDHQFESRFKRILKYKHALLRNDLDLIDKYRYDKSLKILITGAHGFVGKIFLNFLEFAGHNVWKLSRSKIRGEEKCLVWDPQDLNKDYSDFEGFDAVIHLAGENIGKGWWTKRKKASILQSRHQGTERLVKLLSKLKMPPKTFICASAIGYYGDRGAEVLTEDSSPGEGLFLSEVCQYWERAAKELEEKGVRVICTRFGMVLSSGGGALKKMLLPFQLGLGGKIGHGHQYISWIVIDDLVGALYHVLMTPSLEGAVNCSSPHPVTNGCFAKKLARALKRWPGPPFPAFIVRLLLGQKGEELLLSSTRVEPKKLLETGYSFQFPTLRQAFNHVI